MSLRELKARLQRAIREEMATSPGSGLALTQLERAATCEAAQPLHMRAKLCPPALILEVIGLS